MLKNSLFLLIVFLTNIIQCVTGFAGTVLAMPASIMLVGYGVAKPILNVLGAVASVGVVATNHKSINKKEFLKITFIMLSGILVGIFISEHFTQYATILYRVLGVTVIVVAVANMIKFFAKTAEKQLPAPVGIILLVLSGLIHGIFDCGGPLLVVYAAAKMKDSNELRSTLSAVWIVLNSIIMFCDIYDGYFVYSTIVLTVCCIVVLIFAIIIGNIVSRKLSRNAFLILTYVLMFISGVSLLLK